MQNIPATKYLLFLLTGIFLAFFIKLDLSTAIILLSLSLIFIIISLLWSRFYSFYPIVVVLTGLVLFQNVNNQMLVYPNKITPDFTAVIKGEVKKVVASKQKYAKYLVTADMKANIFSRKNNFDLLLTVYGTKLHQLRLAKGDIFQANVSVYSPTAAQLSTDFDELNYSQSLGFHFYTKTKADNIGIIERAGTLDNYFNLLRENVSNRITLLFNQENSGIIRALLTGDKSSINNKTREDFIKTGTAHILAVSGLHVGIISAILMIVLSFIRLRLVKFFLFVLALLAFIVLTGMHPSTIRAGSMAILIYLAWLAQRNINLLNILSFAVIFILLIEPQMFFSLGFRMSVAALLGISLLFPRFNIFFSRLIKSDSFVYKFVKTSFSLTLSVTVMISPIIAVYFDYFSLVSPLANLFVVPLVTLGMVFSIIAVLLSYLFIPAAILYADAGDLIFDIMRIFNSYISSWSFSAVQSSSMLLLSIVISLAMIYLVFSYSRRQIVFRLSISIIVIALFSFLTDINSNPDNNIQIYPRKNLVAVIIPSKNANINLLLDRKSGKYPALDFGLYRYFMNRKQNDLFLINGNVGIKITDELKKTKAINIRGISLIQLDAINRAVGICDSIFQRIRI